MAPTIETGGSGSSTGKKIPNHQLSIPTVPELIFYFIDWFKDQCDNYYRLVFYRNYSFLDKCYFILLVVNLLFFIYGCNLIILHYKIKKD